MTETLTSHFWIGYFADEEQEKYFEERYSEDNEEESISEFASDQGEAFYDHDTMEYGRNDSVSTISDLVEGFSYSDQWADELGRRSTKLIGYNFLLFIQEDQIEQPRSVKGNGYWLEYMGDDYIPHIDRTSDR